MLQTMYGGLLKRVVGGLVRIPSDAASRHIAGRELTMTTRRSRPTRSQKRSGTLRGMIDQGRAPSECENIPVHTVTAKRG